MSESRLKTRMERNTEIIKEVYNFLLLNVSNKFSDNEKFYKEFAIEKFLSDRLYCSWSWIDLITLINLIKVALIDNGLKEEFEPNIRAISIKYKDNKLTFNQPIESEEFKYTILLDKKDNLKNKKYSICSFTQNNKMAYLIK